MRLLRLALGIFIIIQSIVSHHLLGIGIGIIFSMMPLLNIGCCGVSGCGTIPSKSEKDVEDITYEEVR